MQTYSSTHRRWKRRNFVPERILPIIENHLYIFVPVHKLLMIMMIAFITIKSSLVPLIEGLCAQIYFRFETSVVFSHLLLFFFVKEKTC